jgi:hypothetical protein
MTTPTRRECYARRPARRELRSALDRAARAGGHHRAADRAVAAFDAVRQDQPCLPDPEEGR